MGPGSAGGGSDDFAFDNNNESGFAKKRRGRKKRKVESFAAMNGFLEGGFPPGAGGMDVAGGQAKTKRARTSFKHHQLRIMKAHFQINQNPDSRELKMLSQKTGLDKKVLQVSERTCLSRRMCCTSSGCRSSTSAVCRRPFPGHGKMTLEMAMKAIVRVAAFPQRLFCSPFSGLVPERQGQVEEDEGAGGYHGRLELRRFRLGRGGRALRSRPPPGHGGRLSPPPPRPARTSPRRCGWARRRRGLAVLRLLRFHDPGLLRGAHARRPASRREASGGAETKAFIAQYHRQPARRRRRRRRRLTGSPSHRPPWSSTSCIEGSRRSPSTLALSLSPACLPTPPSSSSLSLARRKASRMQRRRRRGRGQRERRRSPKKTTCCSPSPSPNLRVSRYPFPRSVSIFVVAALPSLFIRCDACSCV